MYIDDESIFCFEADRRSEGPFACEFPGCMEETFLIRLNAKEAAALKNLNQNKRFLYIYKKNLGRAVCECHI